MRKITSKKNNQKRNQTILGVVLVLVMIFSIIGYALQTQNSEKEEVIEYNGFEFINNNGYWYLTEGNFEFIFKHNPKEVEEINANLNNAGNYSGKTLYVYSEDIESKAEIYRNLNLFVLRLQDACFNEETCKDNELPLKDCSENFIIILESENTLINQTNNCVFIEGKKENLTKMTDEFLFNILDIR